MVCNNLSLALFPNFTVSYFYNCLLMNMKYHADIMVKIHILKLL